MPCPGCFSPGKESQYPLHGAWWATGTVWMGAKNLTPLGFNPWAIELVARCNTELSWCTFIHMTGIQCYTELKI